MCTKTTDRIRNNETQKCEDCDNYRQAALKLDQNSRQINNQKYLFKLGCEVFPVIKHNCFPISTAFYHRGCLDNLGQEW